MDVVNAPSLASEVFATIIFTGGILCFVALLIGMQRNGTSGK